MFVAAAFVSLFTETEASVNVTVTCFLWTCEPSVLVWRSLARLVLSWFLWFCFCPQLVSLTDAKQLLNEDDYLLKSVYDYWLRKRKNCRGPSLIPHIKQEKRDGSTNSDAYVAFRRRTEKMQTRKVRSQFMMWFLSHSVSNLLHLQARGFVPVMAELRMKVRVHFMKVDVTD